MTMRLKFAGTSADESFTDIFWKPINDSFGKPLNLKARGNVLEDRTSAQLERRDVEIRAQEPWAQGLPASGLPVAVRTREGFVEQDALSEMLAEMNLSTLLYYVLAGEGTDKDESS